MKVRYSIPVFFALALATGEVGAHYSQILNAVQPNISTRLLRAKLQIEAPAIQLSEVIRAMARKHHVQEAFIKSIIKAESGFKPDVVSNKGAIGYMQLMPDTAQDLGMNPKIPEQNVEAGTKYLGWLLNRYKDKKNPMVRAIAAYNAGPGWVDKYKGIPPFAETKAYVKRVLTYYHEFGGAPVQVADASPKNRKGVRVHRHHETELAD
jgi:soluble lytic murein transglycosylase-like protein